MIITTTNHVDGKNIVEYKIVFGEAIAGIHFLKDIGAGLTNIFGGRCSEYEEELIKAREEALKEMEERAKDVGADAIIGVKFDYEALGSDNAMLMVACSGTAVVFE